MVRRRLACLAAASTVLLASCGGGEMTLAEYTDELNSIVDRARQQYEALLATPQGRVLVAEGAELARYSPQDLQAALDEVTVIATQVEEGLEAVEPPERIADLHALWFDPRFNDAQAALAVRAGTAADWEELSETPEMAEYRAALAQDKEVCGDFQARLDGTADPGTFANISWLPDELREPGTMLLGCEGYPERPEDVYRPVP